MPAVARLNDTVQIVHNAGNTAVASASGNVFANNIAVTRVGDVNYSHNSHVTALNNYAATVFVNNQGIGHIGRTYSCGATIIAGSSNVFVYG